MEYFSPYVSYAVPALDRFPGIVAGDEDRGAVEAMGDGKEIKTAPYTQISKT